MKVGVNTFLWSAGIDCEVLNLLPSIRESGSDGVAADPTHADSGPQDPRGSRADRARVHVLFSASAEVKCDQRGSREGTSYTALIQTGRSVDV